MNHPIRLQKMNLINKLKNVFKVDKPFWLVKISDNFIYSFNEGKELDIEKLRSIINAMSISSYYNRKIKLRRFYPKLKNKTAEGNLELVIDNIKASISESEGFGKAFLEQNNDFLDYYYALIFDDQEKKDLLALLQIFNSKEKKQGRMIFADFVTRISKDIFVYWNDIK
jgi:hypothetical protein